MKISFHKKFLAVVFFVAGGFLLFLLGAQAATYSCQCRNADAVFDVSASNSSQSYDVCNSECIANGWDGAYASWENAPEPVPAPANPYQECVDGCLDAACVADCAGSPGTAADSCMDNCLADGTDPATCQSACGGVDDYIPPGSDDYAPGGSMGNASLPNWLGTSDISQLIANIANFLITYIAIPLAILMIILAGFRFVTAQGNEEKINAAKKNFVWTVVGIAVVLASNMIIIYIQELLGGSSGSTLVNFINRIKGTLSLVIGALFALVTVYFIWGIIQYVTSGGDEQKLAQGKQHMVWGIVGMAIMGAAVGIVAMIGAYVTG